MKQLHQPENNHKPDKLINLLLHWLFCHISTLVKTVSLIFNGVTSLKSKGHVILGPLE